MAHGRKNMVPHLTPPLTGALAGAAKGILDSMPAIETGCADYPNAAPNRFCTFGVAARSAMPDREKIAQLVDAPQ